MLSEKGGRQMTDCNGILHPEVVVSTAEVIGNISAAQMPYNVQNALGNWLMLIGQAHRHLQCSAAILHERAGTLLRRRCVYTDFSDYGRWRRSACVGGAADAAGGTAGTIGTNDQRTAHQQRVAALAAFVPRIGRCSARGRDSNNLGLRAAPLIVYNRQIYAKAVRERNE